ncbi:MAG: hypothetical protein V1709_03645 [Planctomycetota bacterium]
MIKKLVLLVLCLCFTGCVSMSGMEKVQYQKMHYELQKVGLPEFEENNPTTAGALNILPGVGNAYLGQWGAFVANLIFWPYSILWGVPQAAIDAGTLNEKETFYFYTFGLGKEQLEEAKKQKEIKP